MRITSVPLNVNSSMLPISWGSPIFNKKILELERENKSALTYKNIHMNQRIKAEFP